MNRLAWFTLIAAVAFVLKVGPAAHRFRTCPDAIAYLDVARNLSAGAGFVSTLKLNPAGQTDVVHSALFDWPPLYPLFAGALTFAGLDPTGLQITNAALASAAAGFVFLIADRLFGRASALTAGVFAVAAPNLFRSGITAMADPLGLVLALLSVLVVIYEPIRRYLWVSAGLLMGAAALTKYPYAVLPVTAALALVLSGRRTPAALCLAGFTALMLPVALLRWAQFGSPLACAQIYHYSAGSYSQLIWSASLTHGSFADTFPPVCTIGRNALMRAADLLVGTRGLFALCAGIPVCLLQPKNSDGRWQHRFVLASAAAVFAVYAFTWSIPTVRGARFALFPFCLLLCYAADGLVGMVNRGTKSRVFAAVCAGTTAAVFFWGCVTAAMWNGGEVRQPDGWVLEWIERYVEPGEAVATNNPWAVNHFARRPALCLPRALDAKQTAAFAEREGLSALVIFGGSRGTLNARSLSEHGFCVARSGSALAAKKTKEAHAHAR